MGLLTWTSALALTLSLAACYAPETRDCTVKCSQQDDCAGDQTCSGGFCVASADVQCMSTSLAPDAGVSNGGGGNGNGNGNGSAGPDAGVPMPDAPTTGLITIELAGKGYVELEDVGTCDSDPPQSGQCQFNIPLQLTVTMRAHADDDWEFERWTTSACPIQGSETCVFVPAITMQLGAKFRKD